MRTIAGKVSKASFRMVLELKTQEMIWGGGEEVIHRPIQKGIQRNLMETPP